MKMDVDGSLATNIESAKKNVNERGIRLAKNLLFGGLEARLGSQTHRSGSDVWLTSRRN